MIKPKFAACKRWLLLLFGVFLLGGCGEAGVRDAAAALPGIDVSSAAVLAEEDSHGGFHGDGTAFLCFDCSGTDIADQIAGSESWTPFPLDDTVRTLVYGIEDETAKMGPYLSDEDGKPRIPEIEKGYYFLTDRQAEEGKAAGADLLHRASLNFTLGIYDSDTDILYYFEMDT